MDSSNDLNVKTKESARVMGRKVVALCLRLQCVKFRTNPRYVEVDIGKILRDVLI